jgi:hypothetical protein
MTDQKKMSERRKHKRVKPEGCAVEADSRFGEIIDISMGGVAFTYIDREERFKGTGGLGLSCGGHELCMDELPVRIISDCAIGNGISVVRRCHAEFGKLSAKQIALLERLIMANEEVEDPDDDDFSA